MAQGDPKVRIRVPARGAGTERTITMDSDRFQTGTDVFPAKEWAITDDVLNIANSASCSIANDDGENTGKFQLGQRVEIDESDPEVADGQWLRMFTGRIIRIESYSDLQGGSNILLSMMDLGWHLTSCHAKPHLQLGKVSLKRLIDSTGSGILIDKTWGFGFTEFSNAANTLAKQGRVGITRTFQPQLGALLPYIQIEPGQAPFDILRTYLMREGFLLNVGSHGQMIIFRPDYTAKPFQLLEYHSSKDPRKNQNNIIGRPSLNESIDGLYSEIQCWSTVVIPIAASGLPTDNLNQSFVHTTFRPKTNPLPFERRHVFSDPEAITTKMRENRCHWKQQMDESNSWTYECEVPVHSMGNAFLVSNTMISVSDTVHQVEGTYYVQSVRRSVTMGEGVRTKLTLRKPLLDPSLTRQLGGGAEKAAKTKPATP